ncbi:YopX family protein [Enterococcus casseliflavus]|uniref:YopX family protein n=1 Tax=Enterococcus casseliflavus TaxID=37734 RepID=UPI003D6B4133
MIYPSTEGVCFELDDDGINILDVSGDYPEDHVFPAIDSVLMQSTGLKDKNGAEVFQGDVVVHEEGEYSYKGIVLKDKYYFYIEGVNINDSFSFDDISNTLIGEADLEVIGNIHENPELLEKANEN